MTVILSAYVLTSFNWFSLAIINGVNAVANAIVTASTRGIGTSRYFSFLIYISQYLVYRRKNKSFELKHSIYSKQLDLL